MPPSGGPGGLGTYLRINQIISFLKLIRPHLGIAQIDFHQSLNGTIRDIF